MALASVITQKLSTAIAQKDEEKFRKLAGANILTAIFLAVVIFVLGISISPFITDWINVTGDIASDIRVSYIIALASSCIGLMVSLFGAFPQVWQDTKNVGMINTFVNIISIVSLIVALLCGCEVMSIAISYFGAFFIESYVARILDYQKLEEEKYSNSDYRGTRIRTFGKTMCISIPIKTIWSLNE